jgi:hypothetical protein
MARVPERIFIRPKMVDVGRGPQPATVPYPPVASGRRKVLPPEGDTVSMEGTSGEGTSGSYWTRRINEGSVEKAEPPKAPEPKQPAAPEHGKKDGKD